MTRPRYTPGRALGPPRVLVMHATAGAYPSDLAWLRKGGGEPPLSPVSIHYLVAPNGDTYQLVSDGDTAWHTGAAAWPVDGQIVSGSYLGVAMLNHLSIGIELSHPNRPEVPWRDVQVSAAIDLARSIVQRYQIPRAQSVRHLDIAPGRKTDPAGFPWQAFVSAVYDSGNAPTRVIGVQPSVSLSNWFAWLRRYHAPIDAIVAERVYNLARDLDIDPAFIAAVWKHETSGGGKIGGSELYRKSNNAGAIVAYGRWPTVAHNGRLFNAYESPQLGLFGLILHLKQLYGAEGLLDLETIIPKYAPAGDGGNEPAAYIAAVLRDMAEMRSL